MAKERDERDERMQGGGYGGIQGRGGEGRDTESGLGEIQGGSYGRNTGRSLGGGQGPVPDSSDEDRARLAQPAQEVDEDGNATTIEDEGRSPERGEVGRVEMD